MDTIRNKDEALSTLIVEGKNLSRIFENIQRWSNGEDDEIDSSLNDQETKEDIFNCLDNINDALEMLEI